MNIGTTGRSALSIVFVLLAWFAGAQPEASSTAAECKPESYKELSAWDFSSLTNTTGNTKNMEALPGREVADGITGENLCLQGHEGGFLQIGKSDLAGKMELPVPSGRRELVCRLTAWRHAKDKGSEVPVTYRTADGTVSTLTTLALSAEPQKFDFAVPETAVGVILQSTSSRRVKVSAVAFAMRVPPPRPGFVISFR